MAELEVSSTKDGIKCVNALPASAGVLDAGVARIREAKQVAGQRKEGNRIPRLGTVGGHFRSPTERTLRR